MTKYKYYFKKPRSEIVKDIFVWLGLAGAIAVAATSPYFIWNIVKGLKRFKKYKRKRVYDAFYQLQKQGCLLIEKRGHQVHISLTEKGKKKAGWFQIDALEIKKPKEWDGKFRIVVFDIAQLSSLKRNVFREKLKTMGFYQLQKSVLVHPFECKDEIELLRDFLGLNKKEIVLIVAEKIEGDKAIKRLFKLD